MSIRRIDIHRGVRIGTIAITAAVTFGVGNAVSTTPAHAQVSQGPAITSVAEPLCSTLATTTKPMMVVWLSALRGTEWHTSFAEGYPNASIVKIAPAPVAHCATLPLVPKPAPQATPKATPKPAAKPAPKPTTSTGTSSQSGTQGSDVSGEPCHSKVYYVGAISQWKVPPGCYAGIYYVNSRNYVYRAGFGWCSWWPEVLHPSQPNILHAPRHSMPVPGAAVFFEPGVQGADPTGHYAEVVAVLPHGWVLISEMNDNWRGGGWGRVNYRYIHTGAGVWFLYY